MPAPFDDDYDRDRTALLIPLPPHTDAALASARRQQRADDRAVVQTVVAMMTVSPLAVLLEGPFTEYHVSALMLAAYAGSEEVTMGVGLVCLFVYVPVWVRVNEAHIIYT